MPLLPSARGWSEMRPGRSTSWERWASTRGHLPTWRWDPARNLGGKCLQAESNSLLPNSMSRHIDNVPRIVGGVRQREAEGSNHEPKVREDKTVHAVEGEELRSKFTRICQEDLRRNATKEVLRKTESCQSELCGKAVRTGYISSPCRCCHCRHSGS